MNTSTKTIVATALIAVTGLIGATSLVMGHVEREPQLQVVKLERVVIVGKRGYTDLEVVQLPRVEIVGRRGEAGSTLLASAQLCAAQTVC